MQIVIILSKNYKYSTVIRTFSEHIANFPTLLIDIWQLKCPQRRTNKIKNGDLFLETFLNYQIFLREAIWNRKLLLLTATARRSCYTLVRPLRTLSCFPFFFTNFFGTNFRHQNKNNVLETTSCFADQLSK